MKKIVHNMVGITLAAVLSCGALAGCGKTDQDRDKLPDSIADLSLPLADKKSEEFLSFGTSDQSFNDFMNEYVHRHLRYDDWRVGDKTLADPNSVMFEREWDSLGTVWFDTTGKAVTQDNMQLLKNWLDRVAIDKFGYVWMAGDSGMGGGMVSPGLFSQGWPFPDYTGSYGGTQGFEFNGSDPEGWTCSVPDAVVSGGFYKFTAESRREIVYENTDLHMSAFHTPFLDIGMSIKNRKGFASASDVDDVYFYWKRAGDTDYSEERMVSQSDFATRPETVTASFSRRLYLPMYLHENWGREEDTEITALKIVIRPKTDRLMQIDARLNYVRGAYDTRQVANVPLLLCAARNYYEFTRDYESLADNINRYRSAIQFMITHLKGEEGLIDCEYFVGQDGIVLDEDGVRVVGHGIGSNYWDLLSLPQKNLYASTYFYKALHAMRDMENMAAANDINVAKPSVKGADDWQEDVPYTQTAQSLDALAEQVKTNIQEYFWNPSTGRFHIGYNKDYNDLTKLQTEPVDYGFVVFNLETVAEGIATEEQARSIMDWISGKRIVAGDDSQGADIYKFEFGPRFSTKRNTEQYLWLWDPNKKPFGTQIQDGGAVLWASYYDIIARLNVYGPDDAWARFKEIQKWYEKVKAAGGEGDQFYREYYNELSLEDSEYTLQGGGTDGGLGLDQEFIENAILYATLPLGLLGINGHEGENALTVSPRLPKESTLSYAKVENLLFAGVKYDLAATNYSVSIDNVRGITAGISVKVKFKIKGNYKIYVNGIAVNTVREGDYLTAVVPFEKFTAEVKA